MPMRKCPTCSLVRYSANTQPWKCERCGGEVTEKNNFVLLKIEERRDNEQ